MKPSIKTALAYIHVTGRFPAKIHLSTWSKVNAEMTEGSPGHRTVKAEYLEAIKNHPLIVGRDYLVNERGFESRPVFHRVHEKNTSHTIRFDHLDGSEGYVSRHGGGWIWTKHPHKPGLATEKF